MKSEVIWYRRPELPESDERYGVTFEYQRIGGVLVQVCREGLLFQQVEVLSRYPCSIAKRSERSFEDMMQVTDLLNLYGKRASRPFAPLQWGDLLLEPSVSWLTLSAPNASAELSTRIRL